MSRELQTTLINLLRAGEPLPDLVIPAWHALELRRCHALEMAQTLHKNGDSTAEEQQLYIQVQNVLGHGEQARRFTAIDILWRCLAVELKLVENDPRGAQAALQHFEPSETTREGLLDLEDEQARLKLFKNREERRVMAVAQGAAHGARQDTRQLQHLSLSYVSVVGPLVVAMDELVRALEDSAQQTASQASESLPTPSSTSPAADRATSRRAQSIEAKHDSSAAPTPSRKRSREDSRASASAEALDRPGAAMKLYETDHDEQKSSRQARASSAKVDRPDRSHGNEQKPSSPTVPSRLPLPAAKGTARRPLRADNSFTATQPLQRPVPSTVLSKLQLAAKAYSEKMAQTGPDSNKSVSKSAEPASRPAEAAAPPAAPRAVAPTASAIIMPPPAATVAATSQSSSSQDGSTSQELSSAAQPHVNSTKPTAQRSSSAYVLVPATQSSNESKDYSSAAERDAHSQPFTQAVPPRDSQENSFDTANTDSLEAARERGGESRDHRAGQSSGQQSFGAIEEQATDGPDDDEMMQELGLDDILSDS